MYFLNILLPYSVCSLPGYSTEYTEYLTNLQKNIHISPRHPPYSNPSTPSFFLIAKFHFSNLQPFHFFQKFNHGLSIGRRNT